MHTQKENLVTIHHSGDFHWVGNGFPVRSVFGYNDLGKELNPFLLLDYAAPHEFSPGIEKRGVGAHPHRGFETVTIAYQGEIEHRDSSGGGGMIGPGDVQWMTAASGIIHDEFHSSKFTQEGGKFEMVQLWVNLPARFKSAEPNYQTLLNSSIPRVNLSRDAGEVRVIAGEFEGAKGPARTFTAINLWEIQLFANKSTELHLPQGHVKSLLVLRGEITVSEKNARIGDLVVISKDNKTLIIKANAESKLLVMTGEPIDEPIVGYGPFVMNTVAEIKQAFADYQMGKLGALD
jgi:quercetin 2,3-dioxygenase